jgi:5-hydroxyisourate hydrolase
MRVELFSVTGNERRLIAGGRLSSAGTLDEPKLKETFPAGSYEAAFHVGAYYRDAIALALPAVPFLDVVAYRFGIADPQQHYHLPFKFTPWGYSCFRGGA